jgi:aldehyde:ferredoxin oxidoreductase
MSYLYAGSILFVDLSSGKITREPTSSFSRQFIGGRGINTKLLYDNVSPEVDALAPENFLLFGTGPLGGTTCPGSSRMEVTGKSPMTSLLGTSGIGGHAPSELKFAGYDHIAVTGKADKPVYLWINNEQVEIRDASGIWGKDTYTVPALLREELDAPEARVLCIGPAGENLVRYAVVQGGVADGAGRTGMGAVMGSKKLKAIAIRGTRGIKVANPQDYLAKTQELYRQVMQQPDAIEFKTYGMARINDESLLKMGHFRAQNFQRAAWEREKDVSSFAFQKKHLVRRLSCFGCPIGCKDAYNLPGIGAGAIYCFFHFHLTWSMLLSDMNAWYEVSVLCHRLGIDIISLGDVIAWLMELHQRGIISAKDTDGIPMEWGSREAIIKMANKIAHREGLGDVLAEGFVQAAKKIGHGSREFAMHVKGLPMLNYPFDASPTWALSAAVGARGDAQKSCCPFDEMSVRTNILAGEKSYTAHDEKEEKTHASPRYEGRAADLIERERKHTLGDYLGVCRMHTTNFLHGVPEEIGLRRYTELYSLGTGISISHEEMIEAIDGGLDLGRAYDCREGLTREQDRIPKRFLDKVVTEGPEKGNMVEEKKLEQMKSEYYALKGWDVPTGIPTRKTLEKRGLGDVADDLERRGKLPKAV